MAEYTYLTELEADTATLSAKMEPVISDECTFLCNLALSDVAQLKAFFDFCSQLHQFGDKIPSNTVAQPFAGTPIKRFDNSNSSAVINATACLWLYYDIEVQLSALNTSTVESADAKRTKVFQLLQEHKLIRGLTQLFGAKTNKELDLIVHQICSNYINPNMDSLSINLDTGIERQLCEKLAVISPFDPIVGILGEDKIAQIVKLRQDHLLHFLKCTRLVNRIYKHINFATPKQKNMLFHLYKEIDFTDAHQHLGKEKATKLLNEVYSLLFSGKCIHVNPHGQNKNYYTLTDSFYESGESAETKSKNEEMYNRVRQYCFSERFSDIASFASHLETPVKDDKTLLDSVRQMLRMWQMVVHVPV